jgi:hypothetical protein
MPVASHHPKYDCFRPLWDKCRVVVKGEDAVKAAATTYLPLLTDQDNNEYEAYKQRASFYNATGRTVEGLAGAVTRKKAELKVPKQMEEVLKHVGVKGQPLDILIKDSLEEVLTTSRYAQHVDAPVTPNADPYVATYCAEDVINWQQELIDGKEEYVLVVVAEKTMVKDVKDPYVMKMEDRWRVLKLERGSLVKVATKDGEEDAVVATGDDDANRTYVVEVWREKKLGEQVSGEDRYVMESRLIPRKRGGKAWDRIPFQFVNPSGVSDELEEPVILDLANVNLSLYRNSADYEHGLHFTALPTVWTAGFEVKAGTKLRVGSNNSWNAEDPAAKCGMLEFTGAGMAALKENMEAKKRELAVLGARLLEEQKKEAEAAATVTLRQAGEQSILSNVAKSVSSGWTQCLKWVAEWMNLPSDGVEVSLSQDFITVPLDAQTLAQISADVQAGMQSWENYFYNLKRAEMVPDNVTAEDMRAQIEAGVPMAKPTPAQEFELEKQKQAAEQQIKVAKETKPEPAPKPAA